MRRRTPSSRRYRSRWKSGRRPAVLGHQDVARRVDRGGHPQAGTEALGELGLAGARARRGGRSGRRAGRPRRGSAASARVCLRPSSTRSAAGRRPGEWLASARGYPNGPPSGPASQPESLEVGERHDHDRAVVELDRPRLELDAGREAPPAGRAAPAPFATGQLAVPDPDPVARHAGRVERADRRRASAGPRRSRPRGPPSRSKRRSSGLGDRPAERAVEHEHGERGDRLQAGPLAGLRGDEVTEVLAGQAGDDDPANAHRPGPADRLRVEPAADDQDRAGPADVELAAQAGLAGDQVEPAAGRGHRRRRRRGCRGRPATGRSPARPRPRGRSRRPAPRASRCARRRSPASGRPRPSAPRRRVSAAGGAEASPRIRGRRRPTSHRARGRPPHRPGRAPSVDQPRPGDRGDARRGPGRRSPARRRRPGSGRPGRARTRSSGRGRRAAGWAPSRPGCGRGQTSRPGHRADCQALSRARRRSSRSGRRRGRRAGRSAGRPARRRPRSGRAWPGFRDRPGRGSGTRRCPIWPGGRSTSWRPPGHQVDLARRRLAVDDQPAGGLAGPQAGRA